MASKEFGETIRAADFTEMTECGRLYQAMYTIRDLSQQGSEIAGSLLEQADVDDVDRISGIANRIIKKVMDHSDSLRKDVTDG